MDIVVKDTNIIIDLIKTGLLQFCALLDIEWHTTLHVIYEIEDEEQRKSILSCIGNGILKVDVFEGEDLDLLLNTSHDYGKKTNLSETDCSVMLLAERYGCRLLTSDQKLKRQAEGRGVKVNGLLWVVDTIVENGVLSGKEMISYLVQYLETNMRAPEAEIKMRIEQYKNLKQ